MSSDARKVLFVSLAIGAFLSIASFSTAAPISVPPEYVITSPSGDIEIGVSTRYGGGIVYYKDKRISDNTVAKGNIIDYSNGGTLLSTAIWTKPLNPLEQTYCYQNRKNKDGKCLSTIPFNNPTQGGYLADGHAGNPNPTKIKKEGNKIFVSYRAVNYNYSYAEPFKPLTKDNESEWQTDIWGDLEISFHPIIPNVVIVDTKITYCKDGNPKCNNKNITFEDNQLSTLFAAGQNHPDPAFRGPYTKIAYTSHKNGEIVTEALPYYSEEAGMGVVGHAIPSNKTIQSPEGWVGIVQANGNIGIGMAIEGMKNTWNPNTTKSLFLGSNQSFPLYSANGWPAVTGSQPNLSFFENQGLLTKDISVWQAENSLKPGGWYKFRTFYSTGDINQIRHNLRKSLTQINKTIPEPKYDGYVDRLSCDAVVGWGAISGDSSTKKVEVVLTSLFDSNRKYKFTVNNNIVRPDLVGVCKGGACGFSVPISKLPRETLRVDVFLNDGDKDLLLKSKSTLLGPCNIPEITRFDSVLPEALQDSIQYFNAHVSPDTEKIAIFFDGSKEPMYFDDTSPLNNHIPLEFNRSGSLKLVATNSAGSSSKEIQVKVVEPKFKIDDLVLIKSGTKNYRDPKNICLEFPELKSDLLAKIDSSIPLYKEDSESISRFWKVVSVRHGLQNIFCGYFEEGFISKVPINKKAGDLAILTSPYAPQKVFGITFLPNFGVPLKAGSEVSLLGYSTNGEKVFWNIKHTGSNTEGYVPDSILQKVVVDSVPVGALSNVSCDFIEGWAYDPDSSSEPIGVHIYDGGAGAGSFVTHTVTNIEDVAINKKYQITGKHGFKIPTPDALKDGRKHYIFAYGINSKIGGANSELGGSSMFFECKASPTKAPLINSFTASSSLIRSGQSVTLSWTIDGATQISISPDLGIVSGNSVLVNPINSIKYTITATNKIGSSSASLNITVEPSINPENSKSPIGVLDSVNCDLMGGWAYDPDSPDKEIGIHIYKDGAGVGPLIANTTTSGLRPDVNNAFGIKGNHGYTITTPNFLKDGKDNMVRVYAIDFEANPMKNIEVSGSPKILNCSSKSSFLNNMLRALSIFAF